MPKKFQVVLDFLVPTSHWESSKLEISMNNLFDEDTIELGLVIIPTPPEIF